MSHEVIYRTYSESINKKEVERDLNCYVSQATWQEGGGGLDKPIRWLDVVCENYDEAEKYIEKSDRGWYDQLAVKYKEYPRVDESKLTKYNQLKEKYIQAYKKLDELQNTNHFANLKAAYISCPTCGSKINREYYSAKRMSCKVNHCPICSANMLKDTALKQIEAAKVKYEKLRKDADEEYTKQQLKNKPRINWLVKIEYHV